MSIDKRKHIRVSIELPARFWTGRDHRRVGSQGFSGTVINIGLGGVFLHKPEKIFPLESMIFVEIVLGDKTFVSEGAVVWLSDKALQKDCYPGMAVKFDNVSDDMKKLIKKFIDSHCRI